MLHVLNSSFQNTGKHSAEILLFCFNMKIEIFYVIRGQCQSKDSIVTIIYKQLDFIASS